MVVNKKINWWWLLGFFLLVKPVGAEAPSEESDKYRLKSMDGKIEVVFDKKYGGAITKIFDNVNSPNVNLIDDSQAGAMFQEAFWILPYHQAETGIKFPPMCSGSSDQLLRNPTQAGYVGDGHAGNPIGLIGKTTDVDANEFIRWEDGGKTLHFKTKFIRYDFCLPGGNRAVISEADCDEKAKAFYHRPTAKCQDLWDTDYYLEQWAYFKNDLKHVLVLKSKITYVGNGSSQITSRQIPIIFSQNLTRSIYWKDGKKVVTSESVGENPDYNWTAQVLENKESGIGMVVNKEMKTMLERKNFSSETNTISKKGNMYFGAGVPDLRTVATLSGVKLANDSDHVFEFEPGGSMEWMVSFPIDNIDNIKRSAESMLRFQESTKYNENIDGWIDSVSCQSVKGWAADTKNGQAVDRAVVRIYPLGQPNNLKMFESNVFTNRDDLKTYCREGKCAFEVKIGSLPNSFEGKKLIVEVWGETGESKIMIKNNNYLLESCGRGGRQGDANGDGKIDLLDYSIWKREFVSGVKEKADFNGNGTVDLADYNIWKREI